jgi:hypothetical protein
MHVSEASLIILLLVPIILLVVAIIDLIRRSFDKVIEKVLWIFVVVLIPVLGPLAYFLFGKRTGVIRKSVAG